jgi:hypothetical protein
MLPPTAFVAGERIAYLAKGVRNDISIGIVRDDGSIKVLAGPWHGGQASVPVGVQRVVAVGSSCWSIAREPVTEPDGPATSELHTVG